MSDCLLLIEGGIVTLVPYACRTWVEISHRPTAGADEQRDAMAIRLLDGDRKRHFMHVDHQSRASVEHTDGIL
jgi:hypothetical protein